MIGGTLVIIAAIVVDSNIGMFINIPSVFIFLGGTITAIFTKFPVQYVFSAFKVAMKTFISKMESPDELIEKAVELSALVRKEGLLALENQDVSNRFFRKGLRLCADGLEPEFVRRVLTTDMNRALERHDI